VHGELVLSFSEDVAGKWLEGALSYSPSKAALFCRPHCNRHDP
jgi:hypothetical protein